MSEENVEIVRRVYEGWSQGDFSRIDHFDPNIDFEMIDWPAPARARGIEEMARVWRETLSAWNDFRAVPREYGEYGSKVLVLNQIEARGKGSGADVSALTASLWTVEGGNVVRLALYWDTALARKAAARRD
jgi:ketosteroid isomerase-like protein